MTTNISKLLHALDEAYYNKKLTEDEYRDGITAIWLSPHLGHTISKEQQKQIDEVLDMPSYGFGSGLRTWHQGRVTSPVLDMWEEKEVTDGSKE